MPGRNEKLLTGLSSGAAAIGGLALLTRPRRVVAALAPEFPESRTWIVRLLGARLVVQHVIVLAAPRASAVRAAAVVDAVHAASMLPFLTSPRYGRAARISGGVAAAWALLAAGASRSR